MKSLAEAAPVPVDVDANQNEIEITVDANGNKVKPPSKGNSGTAEKAVKINIDGANSKKMESEPSIIDTQDNWIAKLLYGGPIGYTVNFILLIAVTAYLVVKLKYSSDEFRVTIIEPYWLPSFRQFFLLVIPTDVISSTFLVFFLFPLSCVSRAKVYNWCLGLSCSAILFAAIWSVREEANLASRALLILSWARLSMKTAAFLAECSWSREVYSKSSMTSLLYFLWIPTLVYKHQYPRARRVRWIKVLCHIWWILGGGFATLLFVQQFMPLVQFDLLTVDLEQLAKIFMLAIPAGILFYPIVAWFFVFENFCGLHGELLRYPYLKIFGDVREFLSGKDPLTHFNTIASKWFSRYAYVPVVKSGGSRLKAMWLTMGLSLVAHDIGYFYVGDIILGASLIVALTVVPLVLTLQPKSRVQRVLLALVLLGAVSAWSGAYVNEYFAWHYSSQPDLDKLSKIRLIPLFVSQMNRNFWPKFKTYLKTL